MIDRQFLKKIFLKTQLEQDLLLFFKRHFTSEKGPLLLAFSGGFDSMALFYLLLKLKKFISFSFQAAHLDHQWRQGSAAEAKALQKLCAEKGVSFHLGALDSSLPKTEEVARKERYLFLKKIYEKIGAQAVVLAHHADDCSETVLKKIFEGASLAKLASLRPVSSLETMQLWRPLQKVSKAQLCAFLKQEHLQAFEDASNFDPKYLRARLRTRIFPFLNEHFGKNIQGNLCSLSQESAELKDYFTKQLARYLEPQKDEKGLFWKLSGLLDFGHVFPIKQFFALLAEQNGLALSKDEIQNLSQALLDGRGGVFIQRIDYQLSISQKTLYLKKTCQRRA